MELETVSDREFVRHGIPRFSQPGNDLTESTPHAKIALERKGISLLLMVWARRIV